MTSTDIFIISQSSSGSRSGGSGSSLSTTSITKKIIALSSTSTPTYLAANVATIDAAPLDGVIFNITFTKPVDGPTTFEQWNFKNYVIPYSLVAPDVTIYNTANFQHVKYNFPLLNARVPAPGMDWFNSTWTDAIIENFGTAARFTRATNLPGVMFDAEPYESVVWNPLLVPSYPTHSVADHYIQAQNIGMACALKMKLYYPGVKIFLTIPNAGFLGDATFTIYSWFLNGLVGGLSGDLLQQRSLVSGEENTYQALATSDYDYYNLHLYTDLIGNVNLIPYYFAQQSKAFSISPQGGGTFWSHVNFALNYQTPVVFQNMSTYALGLSDEYAWVYTRGVYWYPVDGSSNLIDTAYVTALKAARTANGMGVW